MVWLNFHFFIGSGILILLIVKIYLLLVFNFIMKRVYVFLFLLGLICQIVGLIGTASGILTIDTKTSSVLGTSSTSASNSASS